MIGRLVGKRYRIRDRLGGGGTAVVYLAQDELLERRVAVKVLHGQAAWDEEFVRRFRREAQAAAGLSHPNIVSIYDVGQEDDLHFIVMEYVPGTNLKALIKEQGRLAPARALTFAAQVCDALQHAHRHRIVHRDIKPHNILIDGEGRVKVADFGIARAVTSATVTQPGTIVGSVQYFSPEQARGGITTERSDLYSLGVVLYEMLTGQVPFSGDGPITIALKHVQEPVRPPRELVPGLPREVERIVLRALRKSQRERYASAAEMKADINAALATLPAQARRAPGAEAPPAGLEAPAAEVLARQRGEPEGLPQRNEPPTEVVDTMPRSAPVRRRRRWVRPALWLAFLALLGVGIGYAVNLALDWLEVPEVRVPRVVGLPAAEASRLLEEAGLKGSVVGQQHSDEYPVGVVMHQEPAPDEVVRTGRTISLVLSYGPRMVEVPDVVNQPLRQAEILLEAAGLTRVQEVSRYHETVPEGYVINQAPGAGALVRVDTVVQLEVSLGPEPRSVAVPRLVGLTLAEARERLGGADLVEGGLTEEASVAPKGTVIDQDPPAETVVVAGSPVRLVVSAGGGPAGVKQAVLSFRVPGTPQEAVDVRVTLATDGGEPRVIYQQTHRGGELVRQLVTWEGQHALVRVYANDRLVDEREWR